MFNFNIESVMYFSQDGVLIVEVVFDDGYRIRTRCSRDEHCWMRYPSSTEEEE